MVLDFLQRHRWLRLFICLSLSLVLFAAPIIRPVVVAHALTLTTGGIIALVSTFLAFIGITFASAAERDRVSLSYYNNSSSAFKQWVNDTVIQFPGTPPSGGNDKDPKDSGLLGAMISIPAAILSAGVATGAAMFTAKKGEEGKVEDKSGLNVKPWEKVIGMTVNDITNANGFLGQAYNANFPITLTLNQFPASSPDIGTTITSLYPDRVYSTDAFGYLYGIEAVNTSQVMRLKGVSGATYNYTVCVVKTAEGLLFNLAENNIFIGRLFIPMVGAVESFTVGLKPSLAESSSSGYGSGMLSFYLKGEVKYLSNESMKTSSGSVYIKGADVSSAGYGHHVSKYCTFQGIVDGNTGNVVPETTYYIPSTLSSRLDQIEKALAEAQVANQPIQIQVPETDTALVNAQWQDVVNSQDKYIEALERRIAALEQGLDPEPVAPPDPPTPPDSGGGDIGNAGDLKLPDLKLPADVTKVFPFCIPFDVVRAFEVFTAEPVPPRFVVPFKVGEVVNEEIVLDFSQFGFIIEIIRWGELLIFTVGLAVATRNYIKW